jgi:hypothetical protein
MATGDPDKVFTDQIYLPSLRRLISHAALRYF